MPKELKGMWCAKNHDDLYYIRCRKAKLDEGDIRVSARMFWWADLKEGCTPLVVTPIRGGYVVQAHCDGLDEEIDFRNRSIWRFSNGGRRLTVHTRHA
jgi:hypothetical protein